MDNFRQPCRVTTSKVMHINNFSLSWKAVFQIEKTPVLSEDIKVTKNSKHYLLLSLTQLSHSHWLFIEVTVQAFISNTNDHQD